MHLANKNTILFQHSESKRTLKHTKRTKGSCSLVVWK
uniref:Uncharacterized protein n=1 Tax=Anguilla anguilla TaxID=7936 RepID=A0A0E9RE40_ANGAN